MRHWYSLTVTDVNGETYSDEEFALCEDGSILDMDGAPIPTGGLMEQAVRRAIEAADQVGTLEI